MDLNKKYKPISCAFHDYLEHYATLRQPVKIVYKNRLNHNVETVNEAVIYDLTGGREGEFTHFRSANGEVIVRNDDLISVGDHRLSDYDDTCGI